MPQPGENRFLIIRLGSLGDLIHTLPAVAALRSTFPNSRIDWLVERKWSPLIELANGIDNVIIWNRGMTGAAGCIRALRGNSYSAAIDFQGLYKSAILARFSGAPQRIGLDRRYAREPGSTVFYKQRIVPEGKHVIERNLSLAAAARAKWPDSLDFLLTLPVKERADIAERVAREGISDFCVVSPGGGWKSKCWPAERYGAVCRELTGNSSMRVIVNSGPGEEALAQQVVDGAGSSKPFVFSPTLRELVVLLSMAKLVVAADTGPLHLAAALGTPVVALFGPTDPERNGPLPKGKVLRRAPQVENNCDRGDYPRRNSYDPSMLAITVEDVLSAVEHELSLQS